MRDVGLGDKVYAPDIQTFELDGPPGVFGTIASIVAGPVRIVSRVMHSMLVLPAKLLKSYGDGLLLTGAVLGVLGILDLVLYAKWPLAVSQIPVVFAGLWYRNKAAQCLPEDAPKREVEIDNEQVNELVNSIYSELDLVLGKEQCDDESCV